jgi:hypothetical protein
MILKKQNRGKRGKEQREAILGSKESCTSANNRVTAFLIRMSSQDKLTVFNGGLR